MTQLEVASDQFEVVSFATSELAGADHQNSSPMNGMSLEDMIIWWEELGEKFDRITSFDVLKGSVAVGDLEVPVRSEPFNISGYVYIGATAIPEDEILLYVASQQKADMIRYNLSQSNSQCAVRGRSGGLYVFEQDKGDRILSLEDIRTS